MKLSPKKFLRDAFIVAISVYIVVLGYVVLQQRKLLFHPEPEGANSPLTFGVPFEQVKIASTDGAKLNGWWIPQADSAANSNPVTLVYYHGNAGNLSSRAHVSALFHSMGWSTLMATYRGYGASDPLPPTEQKIYQDAQAMLDFARAKTPQNKIVVWGHSLGAAVAAWTAAHNPVNAVILESPFTRVIDMGRFRYPWLLIQPWMVTDAFPTIEYVQQRTMPLLVLGAENDHVIPPWMGRAVFEAANRPKTYRLLPGIDHNGLPDVYQQHKEFLADWVNEAVR